MPKTNCRKRRVKEVMTRGSGLDDSEGARRANRERPRAIVDVDCESQTRPQSMLRLKAVESELKTRWDAAMSHKLGCVEIVDIEFFVARD